MPSLIGAETTAEAAARRRKAQLKKMKLNEAAAKKSKSRKVIAKKPMANKSTKRKTKVA